MESRIQNQLGVIRRRRAMAAAALAAQAGVSRQTIHAIEAGNYIPNTEVSLRLARALSVSVEEIFSLPAPESGEPEAALTGVLSATPVRQGQGVRVCEVDGVAVAIPVDAGPAYLPEADAVIADPPRSGTARLVPFSTGGGAQNRLVLAGCDPAIGLLAAMAERHADVQIVPAAASSRLALQWLQEGKVHIAGSHLEDPSTGEFNLPYLRRHFPESGFSVISFARWEEGFAVPPGNPSNIRSVEDLVREGVRFVNREPGSGSRALLDRLAGAAGVATDRIPGYDRIAYGHLAAAYAVFTGEANCCLATRSAARAFQLDFIPARGERYDFVVRPQTLLLPPVQRLLDLLQRASLRHVLQTQAGYDTACTGAVLA